MTRDGCDALLSPVSPMYTTLRARPSRIARADRRRFPIDVRRVDTRHMPRSAPVVSIAKSSGSFPESFMCEQHARLTPAHRRGRVLDQLSRPLQLNGRDVAWSGAHRVRRRVRDRIRPMSLRGESLTAGGGQQPRRWQARGAGRRSVDSSPCPNLCSGPGTCSWPRGCRAAPAVIVAQSTPSLTSAERAIGTAVDAHNAEALALLERIVNINSGTMNFAGVRQVGDVLRARVRRARLHDALGRRRRVSVAPAT